MARDRRSLSLAVLPDTRNRLRLQPKVVACWAVGDGVFDFGHKFVGVDAADEFRRFDAIRKRHPHAPIALFGHTDAVGSEAYNHQLGYERALAVFAVLRHDPDLWFELFRSDPDGLALLKTRLGRDQITDPAAQFGPSTLEVVRAHLRSIGPTSPLDVSDFLSAGQAAVQSCSEFNPVLVPAPWMLRVLEEPEHRAALQAVNRRVIALFFDPATVTNLNWPCPPAGQGPARCKSRFWQGSRQAIRSTDDGLQWWPRAFKGNPKLPWVPSEQTFACRFYQRLVQQRRCEQVDPYAVVLPELVPPDPPEPVPPLPPTPIPKVPPMPPPEDVLAQVIVNCEHPFRFNKHTIAEETGDRKGKDEFAVVPPLEGDTIYMRIHPPSEREHVRLYWSDDNIPWNDVRVALGPHGYGTKEAEYVDAQVHGNPLELWAEQALFVRTAKIRVEGRDDDAWTIPIKIYPRASAEFDGMKLINSARERLSTLVEVLEEKLAMLIDDFEFEFMPADSSELHAVFQWRELPLVEEGVVPPPDHRVMFWWRFAFVLDPMVKLKGTLEVTFSKVLETFRKLARGKWAEKVLEKYLEVIPAWAMDALRAARLEISPTVEGGINAVWARRSPDDTLDIGPKEDGALEQVEQIATVGLNAAGIFDTASALSLVKSKVDLRLSFEMNARFRVGLIANLEEQKLGVYLQASTDGLKGEFQAMLRVAGAGPEPIRQRFQVVDANESELVRWIAYDGEGKEP